MQTLDLKKIYLLFNMIVHIHTNFPHTEDRMP